MENIYRYFEDNEPRILAELFELLRIPSISAQSEHAGDVRAAVDWLSGHLAEMGLDSQVHDTGGHPLVLARWAGAEGKPTVLFYGHVDVQPVEPLEEWQSPPFEPEIRSGNLYARGASDDKGQLFTHVKAVEAWLAAKGRLPVNVMFLVEGEEEIGSPNLAGWLSAHRELVKADVVVISDTAQFAPGVPSLCTGLRGIAAFEIEVRTAESDLHSGSFGGAVPNAVEVLTRLLAGLHDEAGRVTVPGFYDDVEDPSPAERASWRELAFEEKAFLASAGVKAAWGEPERSILERIWTRPTLEFVGISGGYRGEGHKGIVPARALAKCSARLVPAQDPARVLEAIRAYVQALTPPYADVVFRAGHGTPAVRIPTDSPWVSAAVQALERGFGRKPVFIREGGSISIVTKFVGDLGLPCLLMGFGLPDDRIHSPNEKLGLAEFRGGMRTSAALLEALGA